MSGRRENAGGKKPVREAVKESKQQQTLQSKASSSPIPELEMFDYAVGRVNVTVHRDCPLTLFNLG